MAAKAKAKTSDKTALKPEDFAPFSEVILRDLAAALYEAPIKRRKEVFASHEAGAGLLEKTKDVNAAAELIMAMWGEVEPLADAA